MRKIVILIIAFIVPLVATPLAIPSEITTIASFLLKQEYPEARAFLKKARLPKVDSLFGSVLIENAEMIDYESYAVKGRSFLILCDSAKAAIQKEPEFKRPTLQHYYLGTIEGAAAVTRGKRNDFAGALTSSNVSKKYFDLTVTADSTCGPAQFSIALRELTSKVGLGKSKLSSTAARMKTFATDESPLTESLQPSLFWVYIDTKQYPEAEALARNFLKNNSGNTIMLRGLVKVLTLQEKFAESEQEGKKLMTISQQRTPQNWSDYYSGGVAVVTAMIKLGRQKEASHAATRLLALKHDTNTLKLEWVRKHRKKLAELKTTADSKQ